MSHFYLTLPSNSSESYFPDNTISNFHTKLHQKVSLQGDWEVALSEIIFPRTWFNIGTEQFITIQCNQCRTDKEASSLTPSYIADNTYESYEDKSTRTVLTMTVAEVDNESEEDEHTNHADVKIHAGRYNSVGDIVKCINDGIVTQMAKTTRRRGNARHNRRKLASQDEIPVFAYATNSGRVKVILPENMRLNMTEGLATILGFRKSQLPLLSENLSEGFEGDLISDIEGGLHALYIYCDILECVPVGDTLAPLLRILDVNTKHGTMGHRYFEKPRYVPIQKKNFGTVEIDIRDDIGEKIPFETGKLIVTLHFRRVRDNYFLG